MGLGYSLYFTERRKNRVVRWTPDDGRAIVVAGEGNGSDPTQSLSDPYGLALGSQGELVVADKSHNRVCRLRNNRLESINFKVTDAHRAKTDRSPGWFDPDTFACPTSLFREANGGLLCAFYDDNTIYRIKPDGTLDLVLGVPMNTRYAISEPQPQVPLSQVKSTPLHGPNSVVAKSDGTLYFLERSSAVVREFSPVHGLRTLLPLSEALPQLVPPKGPLSGFKCRPTSLALDAQERLYTCDPARRSIVRIDPSKGEYELVYRTIPDPEGKGRALPNSLAFGPDGTPWVADASGRICSHVIHPDGSWGPGSHVLREVAQEPLSFEVQGMGLICAA